MKISRMRSLPFRWIRALAVITVLLMSGCGAPAGTATSLPASSTALPQPTAAAGEKLVIYAPGTPSSIPVLLAARRMAMNATGGESIAVEIYTDQSQASALFLRGDVTLLVTGLAVGVQFFKSGAPVQMVNSYVAGLTYLVTYGKQVSSFSELRDQEVYIPFEGSPIEEITQFLAEQEGLVWKQDIKPVYSPFPSSVELLKQGKVMVVALPEPFVSLVEKQDQVFVSLSYEARWNSLTGSGNGYPQVGAFVKQDWAKAHPDVIARFNTELGNALQAVRQDPAVAVDQTKASFGFPPPMLLASLERTDFYFASSDEMKQEILGYYQKIGKPLDEKTFDLFFYSGQK